MGTKMIPLPDGIRQTQDGRFDCPLCRRGARGFSDRCGHLGPTGYVCTAPKHHRGEHVACGSMLDHHPLVRWSRTEGGGA